MLVLIGVCCRVMKGNTVCFTLVQAWVYSEKLHRDLMVFVVS